MTQAALSESRCLPEQIAIFIRRINDVRVENSVFFSKVPASLPMDQRKSLRVAHHVNFIAAGAKIWFVSS
jgi:hypothetical protein